MLWVIGVGFGWYNYGDVESYQDASNELARLNAFQKASETEKAEILKEDPWAEARRVIRRCDKEKSLSQCVDSSRKRMWESLQIASVIAIALPVVLLSLGVMMAWVLKGFRQ